MVRYICLLILFSVFASKLVAENESPDAPPSPSGNKIFQQRGNEPREPRPHPGKFREERRNQLEKSGDRGNVEGDLSDLPEEFRKRIEKMSPEQREKFQKNLQRWRQLPQEEREFIRRKEAERLERARAEMENLIRESGVTPTANQQARLKIRYFQERRQMEDAIRKLIQEERERRNADIFKKLVDELKSGKIPDTPSTELEDLPPPPPGPGGGMGRPGGWWRGPAGDFGEKGQGPQKGREGSGPPPIPPMPGEPPNPSAIPLPPSPYNP